MLDICKWGADAGDQKMKARYYPNIDKAKVFGDHYVRDFSEHSRGVAVDVSLLYAKTGSPWTWAAIMTCWTPVPLRTPHW